MTGEKKILETVSTTAVSMEVMDYCVIVWCGVEIISTVTHFLQTLSIHGFTSFVKKNV